MKAYSYVRFSTPDQERGDSLRRQIEQSEAYAQAHGLTLDAALRLTDRGLSAFKGDHRTKGALGEFHRLVEQGGVEPGSVLLVESLDRLSREQVLDALTQFTGLIRAGVKVVTLADRMEYDRDSINANFGQLLMSLVIMSRAHEESATKALRGRAAWEHKRREAGNGHILTARCPAWLILSEDRKHFEIRPEVARVVNRIFRMKIEGKGVKAIVRVLNGDRGAWKPKGKRNPDGGWRETYVETILRNRAVLGEFQPRKRTGSRRAPEGRPFPGYYPAIIEPELFNRVQAAIQHNRETYGNAGGRSSPVSNLFGYIGKCGSCGSPMAYVSKGPPPKGGGYLVCDRARRGLSCKKVFIRYERFEPLILAYCKGLVPAEILPGSDKIQSELTLLGNQLQGVEGDLAQVGRKIANLVGSLEDSDSPEDVRPIKDRIRELQGQGAALESRKEALTRQIAETANITQDAEKRLSTIRELIMTMAELEGQERIDLRLNLRTQLRRLIEQINFFPEIRRAVLFFRTGERRLITIAGEKVIVHDVLMQAKTFPRGLRKEPWR